MAPLLAAAAACAADGCFVCSRSAYAKRDFALSADPHRAEWSKAPRVIADRDYLSRDPGEADRDPVAMDHLYPLCICPYNELDLNSNLHPNNETPQLWNWEGAEAFIGSDFQHIARYKESEVSPQSEWVDLDINREDRWRNRG